MFLSRKDSSACGVGFLASLKGRYRHEHLQQGLHALRCVEHRGACGAESQRDIILAMKAVGGRSNSGEGGENPFYFVDGTSASIK